jgi:GNAT superfamily N-acetyltransferase
VNPDAVLVTFDEQLRRHLESAAVDENIEYGEHVTRSIPAGKGWAGVIWSGLDQASADRVIAEQISRFTQLSSPWEWKHYSYDQPADLPQRLLAAGFTAGPPEALMVAEICELALDFPPPPDVKVAEVTDEHGVQELVRVHDSVFGGDHSAVGEALLDALTRQPPTAAALVAMAGSTPIAAGRVEFNSGTEFASLWGGGTLPAWRGRGVFRSLVARRAAIASARGFRYLQVDAAPASQPVLRRLGFTELATTTPFTHQGGTDAETGRQVPGRARLPKPAPDGRSGLAFRARIPPYALRHELRQWPAGDGQRHRSCEGRRRLTHPSARDADSGQSCRVSPRPRSA